MLRQSDAVRHARQLHELVGARAEAVAAQRAAEEKVAGHRESSDDWERIRKIIRERRGPHQG